MKNFLCVKFVATNTNDIVTKKWMLSETKCYWPPDEDVQNLVKQQRCADPSWEVYSCKILCEAKTYDRCMDKAYKYGDCTSSGESTSMDDNSCEELIPSLKKHERGPPKKRTFVPSQSNQHLQFAKRIHHNNCLDNDANCTHLLIGLRSSIEALDRRQQQQSVVLQALKHEMQGLKAVVESINEKMMCLPAAQHTLEKQDTNVIYPVESEEELDSLLETVQDVHSIAKKIDGNCLRSSVRSFIKMFMKKKLALQYSWTGMGAGRKRIKKSFRDCALFRLLSEALMLTIHKNARHCDIGNAVGTVLCQTADWEGGRFTRKSIPDASLIQESSDADTEPVSDLEN